MDGSLFLPKVRVGRALDLHNMVITLKSCQKSFGKRRREAEDGTLLSSFIAILQTPAQMCSGQTSLSSLPDRRELLVLA